MNIGNKRGITLVALVITIIILLILAGVSIQAITNTGLFENAKKAQEQSEISEDMETIKLENSSYTIEQTTSTEKKTFLEYLDEKGYIVNYENESKTIGTVTLNGREYKINTEEGFTIKYIGKADGTAMLMPRFSKVEAVVEGSTIKVNVELKKSTEEGTKIKYSIQKENETEIIKESEKISDLTYTFENLEMGKTYIITVQATNEYGTTNRKIKTRTISLSELTQGKAEFVITPNEKWQEKVKVTIKNSYENTNTILQYSVGDINNWTTYTTEGFEVNKNTTIYGRFYNTTTKEIGYAFTIKVQVIDDIGPQITIIKQTTTSKTITIEVESKDNELGMPDTITYQYYIGTTKDNQKLVEAKTANTITYDNLQANTKYIVKVQTKDKMENVGTIEKEITTASPILVNEMTLDKENEKIGSNNTLQITATVKPENADDKSLTWSSSDDTIATVSNTGLVTPKKEGNVIITCTTNDGSNISKTCNIQILNGSLIYTRAELDAIRNNPGGSYILMNDIDLSGENWTPIPQFWGTLDGNGHSIDNMTIRNEDSNNDYIAFIKEIKNKGVPVTIKNIKFKNVDIYSSGYYVACVLGDWGACKINMSNIAVESGTIIGNGMVGSLMSRTYDNTNIENCYSHVNINTLCQYDAGGFIGSYYLQYNYNIKNSYFDGTISGAWRVGPIKGSNENDNTEGSEKQYYTFTNLYYNSDNFTIKTTQNATGLTTSQFADQSNFAGWDFENTWIMKDGRPELRIFVKD
jgi:uncharacterized protein YjdB/Tfp pilus assembly protein PilE